MSREMSPRNISSFTFINTYKHLYKHETSSRLEAYSQLNFFAFNANQFKKNIGNWQNIEKIPYNRFWFQWSKTHLSFVKTYFYLFLSIIWQGKHYSSISIYRQSLFVLLLWHQITFKTSAVPREQQSLDSLQESFAATSDSPEKSLAFWALVLGFYLFLNWLYNVSLKRNLYSHWNSWTCLVYQWKLFCKLSFKMLEAAKRFFHQVKNSIPRMNQG